MCSMVKKPTVIRVNKISADQLKQFNKAGITVVIPQSETTIELMERAAKQALQRRDFKAAKAIRLQMLKKLRAKV